MALWPKNVTLDLNPSQEKIDDTTTSLQLGITSTCFALAVVLCSARIYVRTVMTRSFGKDDVALLIALACLAGGFACIVYQSYNGLGRHIDLIPLDQAEQYRIMAFLITLFIVHWGMTALKTAIGFNVLRFCAEGVVWPWYKWLVWGTLGFVWAYTLVFFANMMQQCQPLARTWDLTLKEGPGCSPIANFVQWATINSALNIVTDIAFALMPVPVIWRIKLRRRVRLYLVGIISLGYVAVIFGILRMIWQFAFAKLQDKTYGINVSFWSYMQVATGIMTASSVALRPLASKILGLQDTGYARSLATHSSSKGGSAGRTSNKTKGFTELEMDDDPNFKLRPDGGVSTSGVQTSGETRAERSFYHHTTPDQSGSEEAIMRTTGSRGMGITRTTEVSVAYAV